MTKTLKRCAAFICAMIFSLFILNIETPLSFSLTSKAAESETDNYNVTLKFENEDGTPFISYSYGGFSMRIRNRSDEKYKYTSVSSADENVRTQGIYNMNLRDGNYIISKDLPVFGGDFDYSYTQEVDFTIKNGKITSLSKEKYCRKEDEHTIVFTFVPVEPEKIVFTSTDPIYTQRTFEANEIIGMTTPSADSVTSILGAVICSYDQYTKSIKLELNRPGIWDCNPGYMLCVYLSDGELYRLNIGCQVEAIPVTTTTTYIATTSTTTRTTTTSSTYKKTTTSTKSTTTRTSATIIETTKPTTTTTPALSINRKSLTLENGEQFAITANQSNLTFVSNNKDVAVVSKTGMVTAVGEGSAIISVINSDGDAAQLKLTVVKPDSIGDCNDDGTFSIADIVVLQKWLLNEDEFIADWKAADVDGDGILDVYDLCLMRKRFVQKNS